MPAAGEAGTPLQVGAPEASAEERRGETGSAEAGDGCSEKYI